MKYTMMKLLLLASIVTPGLSQAENFESFWKTAQANSLTAKSYQAKLESIKIAKERLKKHWYPRLYLDSSIYQTDDPAYSFMGKLNQRSIEMSDLMDGMNISDELNNPSMQQYQKHTLGAFLPIYEGGSKYYEAKSKGHLLEATKEESKFAEVMLYGEVAKLYGVYLVADETLRELLLIQTEIQDILKNYKIGTKKNPLGRSGLLGLKTLQRRVDAQMDQVTTIKETVVIAMKELTGKQVVKIDSVDLRNFVKENLSARIDMQKNESNNVKSFKKMSEVASAYKDAAKAYYLPQVGIFAQNNIYNGDRDQATSQMVGVSVKWEFFNLTTFSASKEAGAQAQAAQAYAKAIAQQEFLKNQRHLSQYKVIEKNMERLSLALVDMKEQTSINNRLFQNGIINVLQLSQVLNSKLELIQYYDQAQNEYIKTWVELFNNKASEELI